MQWKIAFWSITAPLFIPLAIVAILAVMNPFWFRDSLLLWVERFTRKLTIWRDDKTYVKYFYDKAHLFEKLKA